MGIKNGGILNLGIDTIVGRSTIERSIPVLSMRESNGLWTLHGLTISF